LTETVNDLYALRKGKWTVYQQYSKAEFGRAVTDAEKLMNDAAVEAVGIIRESPDKRSGGFHESLAYADAKKEGVPPLNEFEVKPKAKQEHKATQGSFFEGGGDEDEDAGKQAKRARKEAAEDPVLQRSAFALPVKLFTVAFIALGVGWGLWASINHLGGTPMLASALGQHNLAAKTMGIGFVISLMILLPTTISGADIAAAFRGSPARPPSRPAQARRKPAGNKKNRKKGGSEKGKKDKKTEDEWSTGDSEKEKPEVPPAPEEEKPAEPEEPVDAGAANRIEAARANLMQFFERCMTFVMASDPEAKGGRMDAVTTFGCQLFFAGAAEILAQNAKIDTRHLGKILEPCALALGVDKGRLKQFSDKYDSYLLEPGYLDMFRAGREAMTTALEDEKKAAEREAAAEEAAKAPANAKPKSPADDDFDDDWESDEDIGIFLAHALEAWRSPKDRKGGMTAVLFTDIVGSTNITQTHGDEASQRLVNIHNSIVRGALQGQGGWEVKHTGDGIMAAFSNPPAAVDAGVDMQRGVAKYNDNEPEIELRLRVGISVGEPIAEDNDLFGTTVQMAARLCDGAGTDGIMVTNMLKEMCQGRPYKFDNLEPREFKGISEPVQVSLVRWVREEE